MTASPLVSGERAHQRALLEVTPDNARPKRTNESLGVEIPVMATAFYGMTPSQTYNAYFSPSVMSDIKNNLGADYVRTEWIPSNVNAESPRWSAEDAIITNACQAGLSILMIIPPPDYDDANGSLTDYYSMISEFFLRYQRSEPGCIEAYEYTNEPDLDSYWGSTTGTASAADNYAKAYEQVETIFDNDDIIAGLFTGGTSGSQLTWNKELYTDLTGASEYVGSYGYHPYDVPTPVTSSGLPNKIAALEQVVGNKRIALTEVGFSNPSNEKALIESSPNCSQGFLTIYEYKAYNGESTSLSLEDNPNLYSAVKSAFADIHNYSCPVTPDPDPTPPHRE
jgi:hypothetical protein